MAKKQKSSPFSPDGKPFKLQAVYTAVTVLALLSATICLGILSLYFSTGTHGLPMLQYYLEQPILVLLNVLPFVVLGFLVWFLSNRAWIGFLISGTVCLVYSWAEYWKLLYRSEPIYAEELVLIREAVRMGTHYIEINRQIILSLVLVIAVTLILAIFFRGKLFHKRLRVILPVLLICCSCFLYRNVYTNYNIYSTFEVFSGLNVWVDNNRFVSRGGMYPFTAPGISSPSHRRAITGRRHWSFWNRMKRMPFRQISRSA